MVKIKSIKEAEQILAAYVPQVKELLGKDITLARMTPLMELLGNPQDKLKIIHIAGTSGKTSTSYYIASLLQASGKKVGLTVSPHLDSVTERVQINLEPLPEAEFCQALGEFLDIIQLHKPIPTYFELLIAFVFWYFAKVEVDYAVIETGLGGLHDATNVAGKSDKVCVITDIGFDHMHVLGKTLTEIAGQKAGIIYPENQVFTYDQSPAVMKVLRHATTEKNAILNVLSINHNISRAVPIAEFNKLPNYQKHNWLLAQSTCDYICSRDSLPVLNTKKLAASMALQVPGRMDVVRVNDKTVIMDGAHNEQKMRAFTESFRQLYPGKKASILLAMKQGKEYELLLPLLLPLCSRLVITTFDTIQDLPIKSTQPDVLAEAARAAGIERVEIENDPRVALNKLLLETDELVIITGSFYLLSCVRPLIIHSND